MAYNNQKLVYASSFERLTQVHSDWNVSGSGIYNAVVFTADGYIVTHGKAIKGVVASEGALLKVSIENGKIQVTHGSDTATAMLPVHQVKGTEDLIDVKTNNGIVTISLAELKVTTGTESPTTGKITVSQVTTDEHGRTTKVVDKTFEVDKVKIDGSIKSGKLLTGTSGSTGYVGASDIDISGADLTTTGVITATKAVINGQNVSEKLSEHTNKISDLVSKDTELSTKIDTNTTNISNVDKKLDAHIATKATSAVLGNVTLSDSIESTAGSEIGGVASTPLAVSKAVAEAKDYASKLMSTNDALVFAGTVTAALTVLTVAKGITGVSVGDSLNGIDAKTGWTFKVSQSSKRRSTVNGIAVEVGDMLICINPEGTTINEKFAIIQGNIDGAVITADTFNDGTLVITKTGKEIGTLSNGSTGQILAIVNGKPGWVNQIQVVAGDNITVNNADGIYTISTPAYTAGDGVTISADHKVSINQATSTKLGGIKTGSQTGTPVELDGDGRAYVNVNLSSVTYTGTTDEITINNNKIGLSDKPASSTTGAAVSHNGDFTVISDIETDSKGRVSSYTKKSVTIKDTTYGIANEDVAGLVKTAVKTARNGDKRDYEIYVDSSGKAWVNVPWIDTTYTGSEGISISGTNVKLKQAQVNELGGIKVEQVGATIALPGTNTNYNGGSYEVKVNSDGLAFVDVPWLNTWREVTIAGTSINNSNLAFSGAFSKTNGNVDLAWYEIE